jgi:hypothetical protein
MQHQSLSIFSLTAVMFLSSGCSINDPAPTPQVGTADQHEWLELFNGRDLDDWTIKFRGFPAGVNAFSTFAVEDGKLTVSYDQFGDFNGQFGHIVYNKEPFSHYILRVEYRFVGEQVSGGPKWAWRNNGIMYHSQAAEDMGLMQDFPTSMEFQLLGGDGEQARSTANLCTPSTQIVMNGELRRDHCIESSSETYHGDQWVTVELEVHGSELARHKVNGETVMEYGELQLDDGTPLAAGYIALQAETHPTEFRSVRLLNLEGCMDEEAINYQSYVIEHDPEICRY